MEREVPSMGSQRRSVGGNICVDKYHSTSTVNAAFLFFGAPLSPSPEEEEEAEEEEDDEGVAGMEEERPLPADLLLGLVV